MKKLVGVTALAALFAAGSAFAAGSTDLTVQANVLAACGFDQPNYLMDFQDLDPGTPINVTVTTTIGVICSLGVNYTVDDISGAHAMAEVAGAGSLPYSIAAFTNTGIGNGALQTIDLDGTVLATDYDFASGTAPGAYQDVLVININP
ncbi:MAG: hypothetical protein JRI25_11215 [Deltaproteobacteria bacterium]|nr:hypothetical protein [Deltaproteobacteria bacterium]